MTLQVFASQQTWRQQVLERLGDGAVSPSASVGFLSLPSGAGPPTGIPAGLSPGNVAMYVDSVGGGLYIYVNGAWLAK